LGANRGSRSGSAPTPTPPPPKQTSNGNNNNYYIRRPTVIFNDERGGPSEKSTGAQARVNNKFVKSMLFVVFMIKPEILFRHQVFDLIQLLIIEINLVIILQRH
jgi:hypothetical protein